MRRTSAIFRRGIHISRRQLHQASKNDTPTRITTLPNKIRVATESKPSHFSSVGLYVHGGSRYETPATLGASYFIDRLAFKVFTLACPMLAELHLFSSQQAIEQLLKC